IRQNSDVVAPRPVARREVRVPLQSARPDDPRRVLAEGAPREARRGREDYRIPRAAAGALGPAAVGADDPDLVELEVVARLAEP
ncbi:hypothetical protein THAOC_05099, partial [Thalassiosira oceanica]